MKVWDGLEPVPVDAGVPAPTIAPILGLANATPGTIIGTYYAYFRYLDPLGQPSNFSPVSNTFNPAPLSGVFNNITASTPVTLTINGHGLTTGNKIKIDFQLELIGIWVVTVVNANTITLDGSDGSVFGSLINNYGSWHSGCQTVAYNLPAPPSPTRSTRVQIFRNVEGEATTFYLDADQDISITTAISTKDDDTLSAQLKVPLQNPDGSLNANAHGVPPDFQAVVAHHLGRAFAAVNRVVSSGAVRVVNGSTTVYGLGTNWTSNLAGRNLYVNAAMQAHLISSVDEAAQTLTLSTVYPDVTQPYVLYAIRPGPAYRRLIFYTEAGQPESWPLTNTVPLQEDDDELTGLLVKGSFVYFLEARHIYRFTFQNDPARDGQVYLSAQRGCINQRSWVQVEDSAMMLDYGGIHAFGGGQDAAPLSSDIQQLFRPGANRYGINWRASDSFHAAVDVATEIARWFVALGGQDSPHHAICYHYRLKRWWLETYPVAIGASAAGYVGGVRSLLVAGESGKAWILDRGQLDGIDARVPCLYGEVQSAGFCSLVGKNALFTDELVGLNLAIISGRGKGQERRIAATSTTTLSLEQPWRVKPDSTSVYQIGGIPFVVRTGVFALPADGAETSRTVGVYWTPTKAPGRLNLEYFYDADEAPQPSLNTHPPDEGFAAIQGDSQLVADMTRTDAYAQQRLDGRRADNLPGARRISFEMSGVANRDGFVLGQIELTGIE